MSGRTSTMSEVVRIPRWVATLVLATLLGLATTALWRAWDAFSEMRDAFNRLDASYYLFQRHMEQYMRDHP